MDQLEKGLTLIEMLIVIAILAILAIGGYKLIGLIQPTANSTSGIVIKEAIREFYVQALSDEGAELSRNRGQLTITSLGANPFSKSFTISPSVDISLDGTPFQCLVLNPEGFPDNAAVTSCTEPDPSTPLSWSITDGSSQLTFQ